MLFIKAPDSGDLIMRLFSLTTLASSLILAGWLVVPVQAETIDANSAEGYVALHRKIQCSTEDGSPQVFEWSGFGYARVPGEPDRKIFGLLGMNVRQCGQVEDPEKGIGYRLVSREIMLYLDPKTGEVMRIFDNPWTGDANEVIHVANDPVNGRPSFGVAADGSGKTFAYRDVNGQYLINYEIPLFYKNAMGGEYQKYVGGSYHATEIFDFNGDVAELLDASKPVAYPVISWVRLAQWLPWMEMNGRAGMLYFNAMGRKLLNYEQLADALKSEIAENYPEYRAPPPLDDPRRNETSWTYMKKIIDSRQSQESDHAQH
jgi:hypothetical protein